MKTSVHATSAHPTLERAARRVLLRALIVLRLRVTLVPTVALLFHALQAHTRLPPVQRHATSAPLARRQVAPAPRQLSPPCPAHRIPAHRCPARTSLRMRMFARDWHLWSRTRLRAVPTARACRVVRPGFTATLVTRMPTAGP